MVGKSPAAARGTFDSKELAALLPPTLGGWKLQKLDRPLPDPVAEPRPAWRAEYARGDHSAEISVLTSLPVAGASRSVRTERREDRQQNIATMALANGLTLMAVSHQADGAALEQLLRAIDLDRAEKLQRSGR
jgi:hypothetical protein